MYYIWKWADNNLPGQPSDISAQLCAGKMPAAIQPFRPQPVLDRLAKVAAERRNEMSELLIETKLQEEGQAKFISLCDPASDSGWLTNKLLWAVWKTGLTLYHESQNRLIGLPKHNVVEVSGGEQLLDIEPSEIPGLLHALEQKSHLAAHTCYDQNGNMCQVYADHQRFAVEWQILPEQDFNLHQIWVAGKPIPGRRRTRLGSSSGRLELFETEILGIADAQRIWATFLAGAERPAIYSWRDITPDLNKSGNTNRQRCQKMETQPPR